MSVTLWEDDNYHPKKKKKKGEDDTYDLWSSNVQSRQLISDLHSTHPRMFKFSSVHF